MRYLVTGAAGFIGSHLVEYLISTGFVVLCIDDLSSGHRSNIADNTNVQTIIKRIQDIINVEEIGHIYYQEKRNCQGVR